MQCVYCYMLRFLRTARNPTYKKYTDCHDKSTGSMILENDKTNSQILLLALARDLALAGKSEVLGPTAFSQGFRKFLSGSCCC